MLPSQENTFSEAWIILTDFVFVVKESEIDLIRNVVSLAKTSEKL